MKIPDTATDRHAELAAGLRRLNDAVAATRTARQKVEGALTEETARRRALERKLVRAEASHQSAEQFWRAEAAASGDRLTQQHAEFSSILAEAVQARDAIAQRMNDALAAIEQARQDRAADAAAAADQLAQRESALISKLDATATTQARLEQCLLDTESARRDAEERLAGATLEFQRVERQAAAEREAAAEDASRCQGEYAAELERGETNRQALEKALSAAGAALSTTEKQADAERQSAAEQMAQSRANFETELRQETDRRQLVEEDLAKTRAALEHAQLGLLEQLEDRERIQQLEIEGDLVRRSLVSAEDQIRRLQTAHGQERANFECARLALEADLACQRTRLEGLVTERDAQLKALTKELEATRSQRDALRTADALVPKLRNQLENIRADSRDQFDNAPVNMCRCSRSGAITRVNRALASLLGYEGPEELQRIDLAAAVFETAGELQWIVDRCVASRSIESAETTWRRKDGTRLLVRVLAVATTAESIDLTAQDVTTFRELEEKLRYARRMEAVARYASEVAVNCGSLLRHVKEEGERWLTTLDAGAARHQGELLLDEVARAAGFLRQLGAYGNEQKKAPELVEVNKMLRDMAPVLKQVVGGDVEIVLPKGSPPLNLDVEAERVERMLVNVAAYGRERMPLGGRMTIEVDSVELDRNFVAKYPNVRPGAHVLLTFNEVRGAVRPVRTEATATHANASDNPGVDLGALQALVSDCGGHLWMMAEPPGDMVLKIHLPRRVLDRTEPPASKGTAGARWINRLPGIRH
jgi:PAS domain S-box-containing protein